MKNGQLQDKIVGEGKKKQFGRQKCNENIFDKLSFIR